MNQPIDENEKRIAILERKIDREKKARNMAEQQLEQYSRDIYETNLSLQASLAFSKKKQNELEYLGQASSHVASELPLHEMVINTVALTAQFCSADYGFYLISQDGEIIGGKPKDTWFIDLGWQPDEKHRRLVTANLPLKINKVLDSWSVTKVELTSDNSDESNDSYWFIYINFELSNGELAWLAFLTSQNIDEEMLSVLDTAKGHLASGIRRRLTDARILKRNVQLQDSVNSLEQAKRQLIQSEKMASLGQLAAGVAHEINNPVAFIRSNLEVLTQYLDDYKLFHQKLKTQLDKDQYSAISSDIDLDYIEEDSIDLLTSNIEGLDRVREIVENLKTFSHAGDETLKEISLFSCIQGALKITGNAFKYEHQVDNQLTETAPLIMGNVSHLQQVFVNLFVNAAYAMQGGGTLSIKCSFGTEKVTIHICDNGCGMSQETINKLFTPFFTTKPVGVGTGLGLSVSYAILEAHEAEVTVDSVLGEGTTFNVSFPLIKN